MKNKNSTYLLIVLVLIVWVVIIYRLVKYTSEDSVTSSSFSMTNKSPEGIIFPDTFNLLLSYNDPFLKRTTTVRKTKPLIKKPEIKREKVVQWPQLSYYGMVKSRENGNKTINIAIDHRFYIMNLGELIENIQLMIVTRDSIMLKKEGNNKVIYRK